MKLNFFRKLDIKDNLTIWPVNPSQTFIKNLISNVPHSCKVNFNYKEEPVDMILFWVEKKMKETITEVIADLAPKLKPQGCLWILSTVRPNELELKDAAHANNLMVSKNSDIYKGHSGVKLIKTC